MADRYPLPADTAEAFRFHQYHCSNPGLLFERFIRDPSGAGGGAKREELAKVRDCRVQDPELLQAWLGRWRRTVGALGAEVFEASTDARLVVGLGRKGMLEVGFAFHRLYGFPVIPGSALKGLASAYALLVEGLKADSAEVGAVFGREPVGRDPGRVGRALFFDAAPARPPTLELDVMNPHFPDYYREKGQESPTNWQSPVPVTFLTVAAGTPFLFAVGAREGTEPEVRARAVAWLRGGLEQLGAGAKTTSGYGYFVAGAEEPDAPEARLVKPGAQPAPAWRRGVVRFHHSGRGGALADAETGQELDFGHSTTEPRGTTFKTRAAVEYQVVEREGQSVVTAVRRAKN